jgi:hypothetical protein
MKKVILALALIFISLPYTAAASGSATLTEPTYRHLDGSFINDRLAKDLASDGRLGILVYRASKYVSSWKIDPALIEDVIAMSHGYKVSGVGDGIGKDIAIAWLAQLKKVTAGSRVEAIAYGNASEYWINKFFPHDREYVLSASGSRLSALLGRNVLTPTAYYSQKYFSLSASQVRLMQAAAARTNASAAFLDSAELENYKLSEIKILNPALTSNNRQDLAYDLAALVNSLRDRVRVSTGKFTITSTNQKLPITVTNDFEKSMTVDLLIRSTNERIFVTDIKKVTLSAKSKLQVLIPVKVYTSGDSGFVVTIRGVNGNVYGESVTYPLKIAVISPVATWITTAAAVVLFGAAILKSLRRLRRGRNNHEQR